eukprot:PhF_6_TR20475/c0_g1_i2/m.29462
MGHFWLVFVHYIVVITSANVVSGPQYSVNTDTTCTTLNNYVKITNGLLWSTSKNTSSWSLIPPDGLPIIPSTDPIPRPTSIISIRCDGNDVFALSSQRRIYFYRFSSEGGSFPIGWQTGFGEPIRIDLELPVNATHWAISQRGMENAYFSDIAGNKHYGKIGCDGALMITNSNQIHLIDNWSWPFWDFFHISAPVRDRAVIRSFAVSAAVMFILSDSGEMWTRLGDFDSLGYDPLESYTYVFGETVNDTIVLPSFPWQEQPRIQGDDIKLTSGIAVYQTGQGNDARELRVVGVKGVAPGYFTKGVADSTWSWVSHPQPLPGNATSWDYIPNDNIPRLLPRKEIDLTRGTNFPVGSARVCLELLDFHRWCDPAIVRMTIIKNGALQTISPIQRYNVTVHHRFMWPSQWATSYGALLIPTIFTNSTDPTIEYMWTHVFQKQSVVNVFLTTDNSTDRTPQVQTVNITSIWPPLDVAHWE